MKIYKNPKDSYRNFTVICERKERDKLLSQLVNTAIKTHEAESFNLTNKVACLSKGNIIKFITKKEYDKLEQKGELQNALTPITYINSSVIKDILDKYNSPKFTIIEELFAYCEEQENEGISV